jgi:hypothetical protein
VPFALFAFIRVIRVTSLYAFMSLCSCSSTLKTTSNYDTLQARRVSFMSEAVMAYRHVAASPEFREIERMRSKAAHDEAQALMNAERRAREQRDLHWQGVVAEKDTALAEKDTALAAQAVLIAQLQALLEK